MENKIKKFNDFINESNTEKINESGFGEFGVVNIHVDGEGWIKNKVASTISSVVKNLQGECHIFVDGVEVSRY